VIYAGLPCRTLGKRASRSLAPLLYNIKNDIRRIDNVSFRALSVQNVPALAAGSNATVQFRCWPTNVPLFAKDTKVTDNGDKFVSFVTLSVAIPLQ
jgi:hypothetical protein